MKIIIISGPTASGKTQQSLQLASSFGGEIVNFDSLLFYKEINIGTAKPTPEEMLQIPHHLINIHSIKDPINAADYSKLATDLIKKLLNEKKTIFLVGGSGFYLQALLKGMYDSQTTSPDILKKSDELYLSKGIEPFVEILKSHDEKSYLRYHKNDHYRIRRAVEHWWSHQSPLSLARESKEQSNQNLKNGNIHGWDLIHIYLDIPKETHLEIITERTTRMIRDGLILEVQNLLTLGHTGFEKPLQSIGYKESLHYINGEIKSIDELQEKIIISTRQLAKSQRTWFNQMKEKHCFNPINDSEKISELVKEFLNKSMR